MHVVCTEIGSPRELRLERQLISSILMSWSPPDHVPQAQIQSYHVYLDGQLKATIRGNDRTKALLEKVDLTHVCILYLVIYLVRPQMQPVHRWGLLGSRFYSYKTFTIVDAQ